MYGFVFGRVWAAALAAAGSIRRWTVTESDPARGYIFVEVRGRWRHSRHRAVVAVSLDEFGLTRVDAAFLSESGEPDLSIRPGEITGFLRRIDRALAGAPAAEIPRVWGGGL